jgi:hypothetical protein
MVADNYPISPSLVLNQGNLHVAYLHQQPVEGDIPDGIFYASNDSGSWQKERVTTGDDFYARPSLAIDADGRAHIAFARVCFECSPLESNIWIATNESGEWFVDQLTDGKEDLAPSLAFDGTNLAIAFNRRGRGVIFGAETGGAWTIERAASFAGRCASLAVAPSLAVDQSGKPWIAYEHPRVATTGCNPSTVGIRVVTKDGAAWSSTTISTDTDDVEPRLALDEEARPHLIFQRSGIGVEYTRRRLNGTWAPLVFAADGADATLAVDAARKAHIAFEGPGPGYATNESGAWVTTPLAGYGLDFGTNSPVGVALTDTGRARVLFARSESDGSEDSIGLYLAREQ